MGAQPAHEFLLQLKRGVLPDDPDEPEQDADAQLQDYHKILEAFRQLAEHGEPKFSGQLNYLEDGVWETKRGSKRLTWYDTEGQGAYAPKARYRDAQAAPQAELDFWWLPTFAFNLRVGHCFLKHGQRTDPADIATALLVRMEDLNHDRQL